MADTRRKPDPERPMRQAAGIGLFFISASLMMAEMLALRQWKITLDQNAAFLVLPAVILGIAAGAMLAFFMSRFSLPALKKRAFGFAAAYALTSPLQFLLLAQLRHLSEPQTGIVLAAMSAALASFCAWGAANALLFYFLPNWTAPLYAVNLLGSALGTAVTVFFMDRFGTAATIALMSVLSIAGAAAFSFNLEIRRPAMAAVAAAAALLAALAAVILPEHVSPRYLRETPSWTATNSFSQVEVYSNSSLSFEIMRESLAAARTPLKIPPTVRIWTVITDEQLLSGRIFQFDDLQDVAFLRDDISYPAFAVGNRKKALIVGSGAGAEVIMGLLAGWTSISAVDINPLTSIKAVQGMGARGIYDSPEVSLAIEDGRRFLRGTREKYDLIFLPSVKRYGGVGGGVGGIVENYLLTREAMSTYFKHLAPGGILAIRDHNHFIKWIAPTLAGAAGTAEPDLKTEFIRIKGLSDSLLLARREGFAPEDLKLMESFVPPAKGTITAGFHKDTELNRRDYARSDDLPYMYRLNAQFDIGTPRMDKSADYARFPNEKRVVGRGLGMLAGVFILVALSLALILLPLWAGAPDLSRAPVRHSGTWVVYFSAIGMGFIIAELVLIEKLVIFTGNPALAFATGIAGLLSAGAAGSLYFGKTREQQAAATARKLAMLSIPALALTTAALEISGGLPPLPRRWSVLSGFFLLWPAGFAMGGLFPLGLRVVSGVSRGWTLWAWGINGAASVAGGLTARLLSMTLGFHTAMSAALLSYLIASAALKKWINAEDTRP